MTGILSTLVEAWTQLRIHRVRVLMSLVGVAVAVAALTASVAAGDVVRQVSIDSMERSSGRPATITISAYSTTGTPLPSADLLAEAEAIAERYDIRYMSPVLYLNATLTLANQRFDAQVMGLGAEYATMHRLEMTEGRWLVPSDADRLAPAVVVNHYVLDMLGIDSLASHPTFALPDGSTAVIVGVVADGGQIGPWGPMVFALPDPALEMAGPENAQYVSPSIEVWVPLETADAVQSLVTRDLQGAFPDMQVDAFRNDYLAYYDQGGTDPTEVMRLILLGISGVVLLLGALSLVNIAVITVRYRVRELGIRRAFGASLGRVFVGVMLESVVGTVLAGAVGIGVIVVAYRLPVVADLFAQGFGSAPPPFPVGAAVVGLLVATAVGALAGLVPALVAVRSKVIDAIRF